MLHGQNIVLPSSTKLKGRIVNLNKDSLLLTFFPGKLHADKYGDDTCTYVSWTCTSCDTIQYQSWLDAGYFIRFPKKENTQTQYVKTILFSESNQNYAAVFFDSHSDLFCEPTGGRATCAVLGAAILRKVDENWMIEGFNPSVGCYGSFGYTVVPNLFTEPVTNKNYFILKDYNSWNGGRWSFAHYHFFDVKQGILQPSGMIRFADFSSGVNFWESSFTIEHEEGKSIFRLETVGYINKDKISEMPPSTDMLPGIQKIFSDSKRAYPFAIKTWYTLDEKSKPVFIRTTSPF